MKTFKVKGPWKWFAHFWFFNHSLRWFLVVHPRMFSPCFKIFSDLPFPMLLLHITIFLWFLQLQIITFFFFYHGILKVNSSLQFIVFMLCCKCKNICICVFTSIVIQYNRWKTFDNLNVNCFLWPWEMLSFYINIWYFIFWSFAEQGSWWIGESSKYHIIFTFLHDMVWQLQVGGTHISY
jgi:hypothetical protein